MPHLDLKLRYWPDEVLKYPCDEWEWETKEEVEAIGNQMIAIMFAANGYGLSGNQIGFTQRIFVMRDPESEGKGLIFVNPEMIDYGHHTNTDYEGCLSLPTQRLKIERSTRVEFEFDDLENPGQKPHWVFEGLNARCIQHEMDHLNGILIFDHINSNLAQKSFLDKYAKDVKQARRKGLYL